MHILDQAKIAVAERVIAEERLAKKKAQLLSLLADPVTALPLLVLTIGSISLFIEGFRRSG